MRIFDFYDELERGEKAEQWLDAYFSKWYKIISVSMEDQRKGIDRVFQRRDGIQYAVEYKMDWRVCETGNVCVETVSIDRHAKKDGWLYTCTADYLIKYVPQYKIYIARLSMLRRIKLKTYGAVWQQNKGYRSKVVLVPEGDYTALCDNVIDLRN